MVDIEAPPPPVMSDDEWDEEDDDGLLLRCFTVSTGFCAGFHGAVQHRMLMCGLYLRDRRFWVCKIIILVMDLAILRGAISMGEEYCSQDDEISEFGWILWASFLVFCKFVYLRPVHHLQQLGVFHGTRRDAAKAAMIELLSMVCHVLMLSALLWRTAEPGFSAYRTVTCAEHGRGISSAHHARAPAPAFLPCPCVPPLAPSRRRCFPCRWRSSRACARGRETHTRCGVVTDDAIHARACTRAHTQTHTPTPHPHPHTTVHTHTHKRTHTHRACLPARAHTQH